MFVFILPSNTTVFLLLLHETLSSILDFDAQDPHSATDLIRRRGMSVWHQGELAIHKKLKLNGVHDSRNDAVLPSMPAQHQLFFTELSYFVLSSLDGAGLPWASILCGKPGFVQAISPNHLAICTTTTAGDPLYDNIAHGGQVAGLGIDFANRRRNKVAGSVAPNMVRLNADREVQMIVTTDQSLGNCPKYISMRRLAYKPRKAGELISGERLNKEALDMISKCDTIFLATKGPNDLDVNHRGGPPGFVRVLAGETDQLVLPDYSGNRLFQSLGNIEHSAVAGVTFVDFDTGDSLYTSGRARNVVDAPEVVDLLPGAQRLTIVTIDSWHLQPSSLNLVVGDDNVNRSPYNPPLFTLSTEPLSTKQQLLSKGDRQSAMLLSKTQCTSSIATFKFKLSRPTTWNAGQHVILDWSSEIDAGYRHMDEDRPWTLNDDFIRSWTITNLSSDELEITVRKAGIVSGYLHSLNPDQYAHHRVNLPMLRIAGEFLLDQSSKALFVIGGIGVTPFIAFLRQVEQESIDIDIAVLFALKAEDEPLLSLITSDRITYQKVFTEKRLSKDDFEAVPGLDDRQVYFCGPDSLKEALQSWTTKEILMEQFTY